MNNLYYGRGNDSENKELIAFLNEVFFADDPLERDFLDILPKIYKDKYRPAYNNFVVREEGGKFRAGIGNFYCPMTIAGVELNACCIGNVAVGKEFRSMGYMIKLLEMSIEDMKAQGVKLAYLGGQRQRYGYFGFEHAGVCYQFGFSASAYRHALGSIAGGFEISELTPDDKEAIEAIADIHSKDLITACRPVEDYFDILTSWRQRPYVLRENGKVEGYIVFGRDLKSVCEFGLYDNGKMARLIGAAFEISGEKHMHFNVGPHEKEKIDFFSENCDGIDMCGCEMILVLDFCEVIGAYLKAKAEYCKLPDGETTVLIHGYAGDENLTITIKDNKTCVEKTDKTPDSELSHKEATRAFFSMYPNERQNLPTPLAAALPLPMYQSHCDTM